MAELKAKRSVEKQTIEAAKAGMCLICGSSNAKGSRGLCSRHYLQFARKRAGMSKTRSVEFEETQIREGRILAVGQLHEIRCPSPFVEAG